MTILPRRKSERGSMMIIALFGLMVLSALGISLLTMAADQVVNSKRDSVRARALNAAEAGVQMAMYYLLHTAPDGSTDGSWRTTHPGSDASDHSGDTWYEGSLSSSETYKICVRTGTGVNAGNIVITCIGTASNGSSTASRTVQVAVVRQDENVSVWNNVIFAGVGQAGKSINGNVVMRGSIHILGDGEDYTDLDGDGHRDAAEAYADWNSNGQYDINEPYIDTDADGHRDAAEPYDDVNGNGVYDPPLTVTDIAEEISGTADIGNNYNGMPANLLDRIPSIPTTSFNGETVQSLSAKLRVKNGRVNISGSASCGFADATGGSPGVKETMDGTYVSDGWGGNQGSASVYSDNGYANGYDLPDGKVTFPKLTDPVTVGGVGYSSYMNYLRSNATVVSGATSLVKGSPLNISGPNGSLTMDADGNMTITGIVYVEGDITIGSNGNPITYSGSGTLVTTGNTFVHSDLLPATTFPTVDRLGVISRRNTELATGPGDSQLTMAGAFYAQEKCISQKQNHIAGTMVCSYFQMSNVPKIYQVPALKDNLPPGMPGSDAIWVTTMTVKSWKEL